VTGLHTMVSLLKNFAQLGWRIELGSCRGAIHEVTCVQTQGVTDSE
jgi:hypothetical protein